MTDRQPTYPGRVQLIPVEGQENVYDIVMADEPTEVGTPPTKANLLSDVTAALFGLGSEAVPNDVLSWIGKYNLYWWKKRYYLDGYVERQTDATESVDIVTGNSKYSTQTISYSESISIDQLTGIVSLVNPAEIAVQVDDFELGGRNEALTLLGKYILNAKESTTTIYYIASDAVASEWDDSDSNYRGYFLPEYVKIISSERSLQVGSWEFLQSSNRDTYPDGGIIDNYEYAYLDVPFANAVSAPKATLFSYIGTGTYGSSNPNNITLDFIPKMIMIVGSNNGTIFSPTTAAGYVTTVVTNALSSDAYIEGLGFGYYSPSTHKIYGKKSSDGKTVYWYSTYSAGDQRNLLGYVYYGIALG